MTRSSICHQPLPGGATSSPLIPDLKRSSQNSRDPWTPPLLLSGLENKPDRRYGDHMYDGALLQAMYGIRLHSQSRYDSCTELSDHFRTDMLSRLRRSARWPLRCWSSGGQWQRLRGSHARVVLGWNALRPRAVPCGHFLASRSRAARCAIVRHLGV